MREMKNNNTQRQVRLIKIEASIQVVIPKVKLMDAFMKAFWYLEIIIRQIMNTNYISFPVRKNQ